MYELPSAGWLCGCLHAVSTHNECNMVGVQIGTNIGAAVGNYKVPLRLLLPRVKWQGRGADDPPHPAPRLKEE